MDRLQRLRQVIQGLVREGIECPEFEFTRQCSLAAADEVSQADFAKIIQGMANADLSKERVYVIGADPKEKKFYPVANAGDFDEANVRRILEKFLEPLPAFEAQVLDAEDGSAFALVVLSADQARPIVARQDVQRQGGSRHVLRRGEIWIKKNTSNDLATRADLERMYETGVEAEAERRAQRRFQDMRDGLEASLRLQSSPQPRVPSEDLVYGGEADYRSYVEQLTANGDYRRFRMLVTVLSDILTERWHATGILEEEPWFETDPAVSELAGHIRDVFAPALRRLAWTGLLLLRYDLKEIEGARWLEDLAELLTEVFEACGRLAALRPAAAAAPSGRPTRAGELAGAALEVLLCARVVASCAMKRGRYDCMPPLLRSMVTPIPEPRERRRKPLLLWPLAGEFVPARDRIAYACEHLVQPYWLDFFGGKRSFLESACQLEFVLHINSHVATQSAQARNWLRQNRPDTDFSYWYGSDLWRYPLQAVVPLAEKLYQALAMGRQSPLLLQLSAEPTILQVGLYGPPSATLNPAQAQERFVLYLRALEQWWLTAAGDPLRLPSEVDWGPTLGRLMQSDGPAP